MDQPRNLQSGSIRVGVRKDPSAADLPYPRYMSAGAAGADLHANVVESLIVKMGDIVRIPTGLSFAIPAGYEAQVRARSGLAFEKGFALVNAPGTIDSDYRGEVKVILLNTSDETFEISRGMRIAQLVFARVEQMALQEVSSLDDTARGSGGFGSTGVQSSREKAWNKSA